MIRLRQEIDQQTDLRNLLTESADKEKLLTKEIC